MLHVDVEVKMLHSEKRAKRWTVEQGRRVIAAWQESGLELGEFGRVHGFTLTRLERWRSRVAPTAVPSQPAPQFVELSVPRLEEPTIESLVEVVCPSGYVVRLVGAFSEPTFAAVLDVLEGEPC